MGKWSGMGKVTFVGLKGWGRGPMRWLSSEGTCSQAW